MKPLVALLLVLLAGPASARRERLDLRLTQLELPGAPSALVPADVDGDGVRDLVVVIAYTEWDQIEIEERTEMDDIAGLVEVLTIVPALFDRRELRVFRGRGDGGYDVAGEPLALEPSVLSIAEGPPAHPIVALTDDGLSALRLAPNRLEPILEERPILARTGNFVPRLDFIHDLDGDGRGDVLLPVEDGAVVYLGGEKAASRLRYPRDPPGSGRALTRHYPLPQVRDINGDGLLDLLLPHHRTRWENFHVLLGAGGGRFEPARAPLGVFDPRQRDEDEDEFPPRGERVVFFGDLDGDGMAEYVTEESLATPDAGMRKGIREAKRPPFRHRYYRMREDLSMAGEPYAELEALGYALGSEDEGYEWVPGGFQDLNGDGRQDLIALTLDFSLFQAVRILTVRSISIGVDFHIWCQDGEGRFRPVAGLDLSGKLRINLNNLRLGQMSQFAGDFDGDGRADFVQMGRGRDVTLHRGGGDCSYAPDPDLLLKLEEAPRDLFLVRVEDYDGDDLSDLMVIQPQKVKEAGVSTPVRLDLYVSGGGE